MNRIIIAFFGVLLLSFNAFAAGDKIGFVDFQKALNESKAGVAAKVELEKEGGKLADELDEKQKVLKKLNDEIEKKRAAWSKETLDKNIKSFQVKLEAFQADANKKREALNSKKVSSETKIIEDLKELVAETAEKKGYTVVLEKSAGGVMYFDAENEITSIVIQAYDKSYRKSKKK